MMVTQKLVTEEAWYVLFMSSWLSQQGEMEDSIREQYPEATDAQIDKAISKLREITLKKSGYEVE